MMATCGLATAAYIFSPTAGSLVQSPQDIQQKSSITDAVFVNCLFADPFP